jgi:hypothetical protein
MSNIDNKRRHNLNKETNIIFILIQYLCIYIQYAKNISQPSLLEAVSHIKNGLVLRPVILNEKK